MTLIIPNHVANGLDADGDQLEQNFNSIKQWGDAEAITADGATAMTAPLLLPAAMPTQPNQAASKAYVDAGIPVASMTMFAGDTAPDNWLFCRGQAISRATYATLFTAISTRFGAGDGTTTFNLPNMQATTPVGFNSNVNPPAGLAGVFTTGVGERSGSLDSVLAVHSHGIGHAHAVQAHSHQVTVTPSKNVFDMFSLQQNGGWPTSGNGGYAYTAGPSGIGRLGGDSVALWNANIIAFSGQSDTVNVLYTVGQDIGQSANAGANPANGNLQPSMSLNFVIKVQ